MISLRLRSVEESLSKSQLSFLYSACLREVVWVDQTDRYVCRKHEPGCNRAFLNRMHEIDRPAQVPYTRLEARDMHCCRLRARFPSWESPGCLQFGGMLVAVGYLANQRTRNFVVLSRLLGRQSGRYSAAVTTCHVGYSNAIRHRSSRRGCTSLRLMCSLFFSCPPPGGTTPPWNFLSSCFVLSFLSAVLRGHQVLCRRSFLL